MKTVSVSVPPWHRCGSLLLAASLWALAAAAQGQTKPASAPTSASAPATSPTTPLAASGAAKPTVAGSYREITWEDLVPKDWDPAKEFKQANIGLMKDGDPRATEMLKRMREAWNNAPTNNELDGVAMGGSAGQRIVNEQTGAQACEFPNYSIQVGNSTTPRLITLTDDLTSMTMTTEVALPRLLPSPFAATRSLPP
jgi:hypothetical protein